MMTTQSLIPSAIWRFAALALLLTITPAATAQQSAAELAKDVARYLKPRDFAENDNGRMRVSVRGGKYMFLEGTINSDTPDQIADAYESNLGVEVIVMTSVPGSSDDEANLDVSLAIRDSGLWTYIPPDGFVASGGTDMFLAGERRILHRNSKVGVHSFGGEDDYGNFFSGADLPRDHEAHQLYLEYYRLIGISEDFYWFTLRVADVDNIHLMTAAEQKRYRVYTDLLP